MKQLRNCKSFPPKEAFFNNMKQQEIDDDLYNSSKAIFESKQAAGEWHSMADYLQYYNLLDVEPLVQALTTCFDNYAKFFNVDACSRMSLPSISFQAMYKLHDQALPFVFTFNQNRGNPVRKTFRDIVTGGLSTVFHRYRIRILYCKYCKHSIVNTVFLGTSISHHPTVQQQANWHPMEIFTRHCYFSISMPCTFGLKSKQCPWDPASNGFQLEKDFENKFYKS